MCRSSLRSPPGSGAASCWRCAGRTSISRPASSRSCAARADQRRAPLQDPEDEAQPAADRLAGQRPRGAPGPQGRSSSRSGWLLGLGKGELVFTRVTATRSSRTTSPAGCPGREAGRRLAHHAGARPAAHPHHATCCARTCTRRSPRSAPVIRGSASRLIATASDPELAGGCGASYRCRALQDPGRLGWQSGGKSPSSSRPCQRNRGTRGRRGGREAEGGGLLNRYTVINRIVGSNPDPLRQVCPTRDILFRVLRRRPECPQNAAIPGAFVRTTAPGPRGPLWARFRVFRPAFSDATEPRPFWYGC